MILLIDNNDSFTYNLYHAVTELGERVLIKKRNDCNLEEILKINPNKIIISPGPGSPANAEISNKIIKKYYNKKPILGVCLGHQCMGYVFGAKIERAKHPMHGKTSTITHDEKGVFFGISKQMKVARYHSLIIKNKPENFIVTAWSKEREIMAIQHEKHPVIGIQFHPESFMTKNGYKIITNFLQI